MGPQDHRKAGARIRQVLWGRGFRVGVRVRCWGWVHAALYTARLPLLEVIARRGRHPDAQVDEELLARRGIRVVVAAVLALRHREAGREPLLDLGVSLVPDQEGARVS